MPELDLGPAIEAAAKAAYSAATFHTAPWDDLAPAARKTWLRESRIHIEGALPELRKAIAEELLRAQFHVRLSRGHGKGVLRDLLQQLTDFHAAIVRGQSGGSDGS